MPLAAYFALTAFGMFLLAIFHYFFLWLFTRTRIFLLLAVFSIVCVGFALVESGHVLAPSTFRRIYAVQFVYAVVVLFNPLFLLFTFEPKGALRIFLKLLVVVNVFVVAAVSFAMFFFPELIIRQTAVGEYSVGIGQYFRATFGIFNWLTGIIVTLISIHRRQGNVKRTRILYLSGYLVLALGSLVDALLVAYLVESGDMILGFYPGMLAGLAMFHIAVSVALSRDYRDNEQESETSAHVFEGNKMELMRMAYYDDMTSRPNRKSFLLHLDHHIIETLSSGKTKAVFIIDLDNFRDINDTFGYEFGDLVIQSVGGKIENRFGVFDRFYRLYGNRFAIIWDDIVDKGHAIDVARGIMNDLTSLVKIDNSNLYVGVSIGAVLLPDDGNEVNEVFRRCETALAEAKKDKNTYFFYSTELEHRTRKKMSIVGSLREALMKKMFDVVYQPIVDARGGLKEMEALIRCRHPDLAGISPEIFIPLAESSGLIIPLTWWLIDRVVRDSRSFAVKKGMIRVNINMSPKILKSRDLVDRIIELDSRKQISGSLIGFEITESAIIENVDQVLKNLRALRARGYPIVLDDFGTGYSSLSYIKSLPLNKIKIDKRFVSGISRDERDEALINSIISIANNLKMDIVAEGVEMPNQLAYLDKRGCRYFQGYLFSKPVSIDAIVGNYPIDPRTPV